LGFKKEKAGKMHYEMLFLSGVFKSFFVLNFYFKIGIKIHFANKTKGILFFENLGYNSRNKE